MIIPLINDCTDLTKSFNKNSKKNAKQLNTIHVKRTRHFMHDFSKVEKKQTNFYARFHLKSLMCGCHWNISIVSKQLNIYFYSV